MWSNVPCYLAKLTLWVVALSKARNADIALANSCPVAPAGFSCSSSQPSPPAKRRHIVDSNMERKLTMTEYVSASATSVSVKMAYHVFCGHVALRRCVSSFCEGRRNSAKSERNAKPYESTKEKATTLRNSPESSM